MDGSRDHAALNPIDITGQVLNDMAVLDEAVALMADGGFGAIASFQAVTGITPRHRPLVRDTWAKFRAAHPDIAVALVTVFNDEDRRFLEEQRCLAFDEPERTERAHQSCRA